MNLSFFLSLSLGLDEPFSTLSTLATLGGGGLGGEADPSSALPPLSDSSFVSSYFPAGVGPRAEALRSAPNGRRGYRTRTRARVSLLQFATSPPPPKKKCSENRLFFFW